ncbi:hypothetical protein BO94DRAFT_623886 [Aspergillus sclerotioniger CBS 115572]|uniref:Aminoglycoside phosphotransferase domain-containing protein n=1 Tax=Aspergillus sclerotioniger CBS 115572 TaxID=1450535 RepID=A0A317WU56_9EURO|nr:hypothetical protein BO94DRAFT_623886 [Aspergillus sclerotioniger CBS 115572]PWY88822.1 hypothetical protein BO94DRAFT_623886 [Aspergillus sclerotioniger CBS 115572]
MATTPVQTRRLLREEITYSVAKEKEVNILHRLQYPDQQSQFFALLDDRRDWIQTVVAHHLSLKSPNNCHVANKDDWLHGSFNVCIPVTVGHPQCNKRVLLRVPLPYRIGEAFRPGNGDEKIRYEAATYAWIGGNCPDVSIPRLYGFAASTGDTFTRLENLPFLTRYVHRLRCWKRSLFRLPVPSCYVRHDSRHNMRCDKPPVGYLLVEYIEESTGTMLFNTWPLQHTCSRLRTNFFRDLSRIFLSLAKIPLQKIGSFTIDNRGFLKHTNRPLSLGIQELENEEIPVDMPRDYTYSNTDSYIVDTLAYHDNRLRHQPNAINHISDFAYQASALAAMRAIFPLFFRRELRRAPFFFALTDIHQSNILPPHWFTNKSVDHMDAAEYNNIRLEFMSILEEEELALAKDDRVSSKSETLSKMMNQAWKTGTFWFSLALTSPAGLFFLFDKHIQPIMTKHCPEHDEFHGIMSWYWTTDTVGIARCKLADKKDYDNRLRQAFGMSSEV